MTSSDSPLIKVCGLTTAEDVSLCQSLRVDMIGFIFHFKSPRHIDPAGARRLSSSGPLRVGVFVEQTADEVLAIMAEARLDMAQLHGGQSVEDCLRVGPERVIKVFWPQRYSSLDELEGAMADFSGACSFCLVDAGIAGGGHGQTLDFTRLLGLRCPKPWILAGGLGPGIIEEALSCRPDGLDLNSGVERAPGIKDPGKLRLVVERIRSGPDAATIQKIRHPGKGL
jgi:phosphoribosylanthranilate isomerase